MDTPGVRSYTRLRPAARAAIGLVLAVAVLAVFVWFTGGVAVLRAISRADPGLVAVGSVAGVAAILSWGEALRRALGGTRPIGGLKYRLTYLSGDFARQVLPMGRLSGSAIIAYAVSRPFDYEYEEGLAAVTVTDLLNLVSAISLSTLGLAIVFLRAGVGDVRTFLGGLTGALVVAVGVVALVTRRRRAVERAVELLSGIVYRGAVRLGVESVARRFEPETMRYRVASYFGALDAVADDRRRVAATASFVVVGWMAFAASLTAAAAALGVGVPFAAALFAAPAAGLVGWSPLPGGTGGVEVAVTAGLVAVAGVSVESAAAVALLYRVCSYWVVVAVDALATGLLTALEAS
ncbi:flippase-like domain-containing protein [Halopelagius fulvigenes]|uniref:Flippase-like domain-containing protein n=1 Tax=Halopelagius fulvigenes TaxID=1198324 RepID=A0ABD5U5V8_9EURY